MRIRPSHGFSLILIALLLTTLFVFFDFQWRHAQAFKSTAQMIDLVRRLQLTDLCLATEATYTRHPSQADFFAPFASHPGALEHFPSGTIIGPAPHLKDHYEPLP